MLHRLRSVSASGTVTVGFARNSSFMFSDKKTSAVKSMLPGFEFFANRRIKPLQDEAHWTPELRKALNYDNKFAQQYDNGETRV